MGAGLTNHLFPGNHFNPGWGREGAGEAEHTAWKTARESSSKDLTEEPK